MDERAISKALVNYTVNHSKFEIKRNYISLSHCMLSAKELLEQFNKGFEADVEAKLKCYKGYQMEADLVVRIKNCFNGQISDGGEISAFEGLVKGHPDFRFDCFPGDCKSVARDDWLPMEKVPYKVYCQMQGYMKYMDKNKALVIYESRESGLIKSFWIQENKKLQAEIDGKLGAVVGMLHKKVNAI